MNATSRGRARVPTRRLAEGRCRGQSGMSLFEVLATTALLAVLVSLCLRMFVTHNRLTAINALGFDRLEGIREIQETFREEAREAVAVVDEVLNYRTDADTLVLQKVTNTKAPLYQVWNLDGKGKLSYLDVRLVDGTPAADKFLTLRQPLTNFSFVYNGVTPASSNAITVSFAIQHEEGERVPATSQTYPVTVALRARAHPEMGT